MAKVWHVRQQKHLLRKVTYFTFKIIGFAPFAIQHPKKVNKSEDSRQDHRQVSSQFVSSYLGGLYNFFLIPGQLYLAFFSSGIYDSTSFPFKSELTDKIELAITICAHGIVSIIWLIYCIEQKTLAALVNRLTEVDVTLAGVKDTSIDIHGHPSGFRKYFILTVASIFLWTQLLLSEKFGFNASFITWFTFIVPCIIIHWFIVQFILAINFMENRFKLLNNILLNLSMTPIVFPLRSFFNGRISTDDFQLPKIVTLRKAHTSLYEITSGVADFYSFPILLVIGFVSLSVLYNANYLVVVIAFGPEDMTKWVILNPIFWLIVQIYPITMLITGVNGVTNEMMKATTIIPNLLTQPTTSRRDKMELENFAFGMLRKDVQFTAYRFFPLDGNLLQSMFGMVGTYLTIMIQFQGKSVRNSALNNSTAYNFTHTCK